MARPLTRSERQIYADDGVVHVPKAVDSHWVDQMLAAVDRQMAAPGRFGGNITPADRPGKFFQDRYLHPHDPEFASFVHDVGLAELAAEGTGSNQVRIYYEHLFVKDPGTTEQFAWHQDRPFWAVDGTQICSTWLALTSATAASSALEFVRGSHAWGKTFRPDFPGMENASPQELEDALWDGLEEHVSGYDEACPAFEDEPDRYEVISFDVEPGDVVMFDFRTCHRSRGNAGANRRVAISWRWLGDDTVWSPTPGSDPIITQKHTFLAPGDLVTDDATFPIAFSGGATV